MMIVADVMISPRGFRHDSATLDFLGSMQAVVDDLQKDVKLAPAEMPSSLFQQYAADKYKLITAYRTTYREKFPTASTSFRSESRN